MMKRNIVRAAGLIILTASVLLFLNLMTPVIYHSLPNDYLRTSLILDSLDKGIDDPSVVIFGNSRGMSGIDGRQLEDSLGLRVYNFCTPSQSLMESFLYYDKLPQGVKLIVQCIDEREFDESSIRLKESAIVAFSMSSYHPSSSISSMLNKDDLSSLTSAQIVNNFRARHALKTGLSHSLVALLDDDAPGGGIYDIHSPYMYPSDSSNTYQRDLDHLRNYVPAADHEFSVPSELKNFISEEMRICSEKGVKIVYLLMPLCPDLGWQASVIESKVNSVKSTIEPGQFINALTLLDAADFYDPVHPNRKGAKKITSHLSSSLKK